jgi:hypothetical protein
VVPTSRFDRLEGLPDTAGLYVPAAVPRRVPQQPQQPAGQGQVELPVVDPVLQGRSSGQVSERGGQQQPRTGGQEGQGAWGAEMLAHPM